MVKLDQEIGQKLRRRREELGLTAEQVAEQVGTSGNQIYKLERGERRMTLDWLGRISVALRTTAVEMLTKDAEPTGAVMVKGYSNQDLWIEGPALWPKEEWEPISVPEDERFPGIERFALKCSGGGMSAVFTPGCFLICICLRDLKQAPIIGKRYIVFRERDGKRNLCCKKLVTNEDGELWLVGETLDPTKAESFPVIQAGPGADRVEIVALVIASYQPEP